MALYSWHGKEQETLISEVHTRKAGKDAFEAVILPPNHDDPEAVAKMVTSLERAGYALSPFKIQHDQNHTLTITGDARKMKALEKGLSRTWMGKRAELTRDGDTLTLSGLSHQVEIDSTLRWMNSHSYTKKKGFEFNHTHSQENPTQGLHVSGIKNEERFLSIVEQNGAQGERRDEFHGLSPIKKMWANAARSSKKYASALYMLAEGQVLMSVLIDSARRGINPLKHEAIAEPIGYLAGSAGMFAGSLLSELPSSQDVVGRFKESFKVGDSYDFEGKNSDFSERGRSWGRGPDRIKDVFRDNGTEFLMLLNTYAATGLLRGQYNEIFSTNITRTGDEGLLGINKEPICEGDICNVEISAETGEKKKATRFQLKNLISGTLLTTFTLAYALVPRQGNRDPAVRWDTLYDKALDTPVLGGMIRFAVGLEDTFVGRALTYAPRKVVDAFREKPEEISGRMFQLHNVNQVGLGGLDVLQVRKESKLLERQFAEEGKALRKGALTPPYGKEGFSDGFTHADVNEVLSKVYNLEDTKTYQQVWTSYEEKLERNEKPSDQERYVATKALNRIFLDQLNQEVSQFKWKLSGNASALFAGFFMAHTGDTHHKINQAQAAANGFAVAQGIVSELRSEGQLSDKSIHNAALYMHQDAALKHHGFGVEQFENMLNAYADGKIPQEAAQQFGSWKPDLASPSAKLTYSADNMKDVANSTTSQQGAESNPNDNLQNLAQQISTTKAVQPSVV